MDNRGLILNCKSNLNVIIFIIVALFYVNSSAQDIHFSQFDKAPILLNAAQTGVFDADLRLSGIYRNQWRQIDDPYSTFQLAIDGQRKVFTRPIGLGAIIINDHTQGKYLNTNKIYFSLSHSFYYRNHQIVAGIQPGFVLGELNNSNIIFGDQFNSGTQAFDRSTAEQILNENLRYFHLNAGVFWRASIKKIMPNVGVSFQNINRPEPSFLPDDSVSNPLKVQYNITSSLRLPLVHNYFLTPMVLYSGIGASKNMLAGVRLDYLFANATVKNNVYTSVLMRVNPFKNIDACVFVIGTNMKQLDLSLSYDFNVSTLRKSVNFNGAYELALIFRLNSFNSNNLPQPCIIM